MRKEEKILFTLNLILMILNLGYTIANISFLSTTECEHIQIE